MDPLPCSHIVYRALLRRPGCIDPATNTLLPGAFLLRPPPADADGLSVDIDSPATCVSGFKKTYGVASLHVGRVRNLGLDVKPDEGTHACIVGLPNSQDDPANAERLAVELAKIARYIANPA